MTNDRGSKNTIKSDVVYLALILAPVEGRVLLVEKLQFYLLPLPLEGVLLLRRSHRLLQFLLSLVEFFPFSKGVFLILEVEVVLQ